MQLGDRGATAIDYPMTGKATNQEEGPFKNSYKVKNQ